MLYRELEVEKYWDMPSTKADKKEKIHNAILMGNYGASIKKDGEYIRAIYDTDGEIWIIGRGTNAKEVHNLDKHLVFITEWLKTNFQPGTCLLGELYVPGKTSRAIRAYTGSLVPKSLKNQKDCPPMFYIFDTWAVDGQSYLKTPYKDRMTVLSIVRNHVATSHAQIQFPNIVTGAQEILDFIAQAFEDGEEGCVLVKLDSTVDPGKRTSWKTIKVKKEFQDKIDCFLTGNGKAGVRLYAGSEIEDWIYWENLKTGEIMIGSNYNNYRDGMPIEPVTKSYAMGWPGSLEVGVFKGKDIFSLCYVSGITDALKEDFANNPSKYTMKTISLTGMMATDNSIRHPKFVGFREDLPLEDCTYEKIFGE